MPYCPQCGTENDAEAGFCKRCGYSLKGERPRRRRREKEEKHEKQEKDEEKYEKEEKHEKGEVGALGQLVGGLILIFVGVAFYLTVNDVLPAERVWPYFVIIAGLLVVVLAFYGGRTAWSRHPRP